MPTERNSVLMAPLRAALTAAGLEHVRTYIQSGNVIATSHLAQSELEGLVHSVISASFGGDVTVIARTAEQFRSIIARNPFPETDAPRLYFSVLASRPKPDRVAAFLSTDWEPDDVRIIEDAVYTRYATKHSDSKFNNDFFERRLQVPATTRNFNTMTKLIKLSAA